MRAITALQEVRQFIYENRSPPPARLMVLRLQFVLLSLVKVYRI